MNSTSIAIRGLWAWSLTMLFLYLKLTGQIDWNWAFVLLPAIVRTLFVQGVALYIGTLARRMAKDSLKAQQEMVAETPPWDLPTGHYV